MSLESEYFRKRFWRFFESFDFLEIDIRTIENLNPKSKKFIMKDGVVYYGIVPNFRSLVEKYYHYFNDIEKLIQESKCLDILNMLGIKTNAKEIIIENVVYILDLSYLFQERIRPSYMRKDSDLQDVEFYFYEDTNNIIEGLFKIINKSFIIINVVFILTNIKLQTPLRISERILIRELKDIEGNILINHQLRIYRSYEDYGYRHVIEKKYRVNHDSDRDTLFNDITDTMNKVLTAVRLISGIPNCELFIIKTNYGTIFPYYIQEFPKINSESLTIERIDLMKVYGWLDKVEMNRSLLTAIERFNSGLMRSSIADKMVDFSISFESLFVNPIGEGKENIGYKLKTRVARLLFQEFDKRVEAGAFMRDFYNGRSNIVHSNNMDKSINDVTLRCQNYLRDSIKLYLEGLYYFSKNKDIQLGNRAYDDFHQYFLDHIDFET